MNLVVDASVATLWVLDQDGSSRAAALRGEDTLIAPSLVASEICSALWKAVRRREVTPPDALEALEAALLGIDDLVPLEDLRARALTLAMELDHPVYDCFYLALAEREQCPCITADKRLLKTAAGLKSVDLRAL